MSFKTVFRIFVGLGFVLSLQACSLFTDSPGVKTLRSKAESGDPQSQYQMGLRYTNGQEVVQNYAVAADWFNRSARLGHAPAQFMLGVAYSSGRGVGANNSAAFNLFTAAAQQGHGRAQYQLGNAYANGRGTERDRAWAARWYGKSARQGHAAAMFSLGISWARGLGFPADPVRGLSWLNLASAKGSKQSLLTRDKLASTMKATDVQKAKALAAQWKISKSAPYADTPTVLYVQRGLRLLKIYPGKVDGIFGPMTKSSIKKYSTKADLSPAISVTSQIDEELVNSIRAELKKAK